jgi:hypothetical protein
MIDSAQLVNTRMNILFERHLWKCVCGAQENGGKGKWCFMFTETAFVDWKIIN